MRPIRFLSILALAAPAALGCGHTSKPQPTQITAAPVPGADVRIVAMRADIARLEKERDEARRAAADERNRHNQYVLLQQDRNDLEDRAWARLAEVDGYVLKLEERANKATGAARTQLEHAVTDAAKKRELIERDLRRVHTETERAFAQLKRDLETRLDDLYTHVREAAERK
jgi:hypothetical protein